MRDPLPRILAFLEGIRIPVIAEPVTDTLLPGATVRYGTLAYDPDRLPWPGDLLHEAGHIAVSDPAIRATLPEIVDDPGEEMAAMAWSYAAALAIGIDPAIVFHDGGYKDGGSGFLASYVGGDGIGVPMLRWYGMTDAFPAMTRWLR